MDSTLLAVWTCNVVWTVYKLLPLFRNTCRWRNPVQVLLRYEFSELSIFTHAPPLFATRSPLFATQSSPLFSPSPLYCHLAGHHLAHLAGQAATSSPRHRCLSPASTHTRRPLAPHIRGQALMRLLWIWRRRRWMREIGRRPSRWCGWTTSSSTPMAPWRRPSASAAATTPTAPWSTGSSRTSSRPCAGRSASTRTGCRQGGNAETPCPRMATRSRQRCGWRSSARSSPD